MKIRNGFVSNSSSSSFIVAFPKKPKNAKDVLEFMFGNRSGTVEMEYYDEKLSYEQVAETVFKDIKSGVDIKGIIEVFKHRYHYYIEGNNFLNEYSIDNLGGRWSSDLGRYYGNNEKLMGKLRDHIIAVSIEDRELNNEERAILGRTNLGNVPYAYKGRKDDNGRPLFTKAQIKAYYKDQKDLSKFRKTDPEYVAWDKKRRESWDRNWKIDGDLRIKIAIDDAQNFLDDNKGKFVFIVNYGDDSGQALMEHGDIFRNVNHITISQH